MDIWSKEKRSEVMSRIRSKDTKPEKAVRSALHFLGFRFRLHRKDLPGHPDIVLPKYRVIIFVHGCFWHKHENCRDGKFPKTDRARWRKKLQGNVRRDKEAISRLRKSGWYPVVVWECAIRKDLSGAIKSVVSKIRKRKI
jgi:DNA mismatch endonuclease, patch repair protein